MNVHSVLQTKRALKEKATERTKEDEKKGSSKLKGVSASLLEKVGAFGI